MSQFHAAAVWAVALAQAKRDRLAFSWVRTREVNQAWSAHFSSL